MKTERRHDLETNELARYAASWIEKCKPYASQIFGAAIVFFGLLILISLWGSTSNVKEQAAWDEFAKAINAGDQEMFDLQQVATDEDYAGTKMQEWAQATWADRQTALATANYLTDREETKNRLEQVAPMYESLVETAKNEEIRDRARYGLGRVYELQNRLEEAREQYDQVGGTYELLARSRSEALMKPETQESYEWLSTAELPKRSTAGASGQRPAFEAPLPTGGFDASSVEDILGLPQDSDDETSSKQPVGNNTKPPVFELDEIFMEEGTTESDAPTADDSSTEETSVEGDDETDTEADDETAEP